MSWGRIYHVSTKQLAHPSLELMVPVVTGLANTVTFPWPHVFDIFWWDNAFRHRHCAPLYTKSPGWRRCAQPGPRGPFQSTPCEHRTPELPGQMTKRPRGLFALLGWHHFHLSHSGGLLELSNYFITYHPAISQFIIYPNHFSIHFIRHLTCLSTNSPIHPPIHPFYSTNIK